MQDVAPLGPLEERGALGEADQQPGRVLEVRHEVEQPRAAALALPAAGRSSSSSSRSMPSASCRTPTMSRLHVAERGDRAGIGRQLDEDDVVRIEQHARDEVEPLLRAGRDEQPLERRGRAAVRHDAGDRLEQRPVAARRAVLQHRAVARPTAARARSPETPPRETSRAPDSPARTTRCRAPAASDPPILRMADAFMWPAAREKNAS